MKTLARRSVLFGDDVLFFDNASDLPIFVPQYAAFASIPRRFVSCGQEREISLTRSAAMTLAEAAKHRGGHHPIAHRDDEQGVLLQERWNAERLERGEGGSSRGVV